MVERIQLNWYRIPEDFSKRYQWYFLILGNKNSINTTRKNLHDKLGLDTRERLVDFGKAENNQFYGFFCFESITSKINFSSIEAQIEEQEKVSNGKWRDLVNFL